MADSYVGGKTWKLNRSFCRALRAVAGKKKKRFSTHFVFVDVSNDYCRNLDNNDQEEKNGKLGKIEQLK